LVAGTNNRRLPMLVSASRSCPIDVHADAIVDVDGNDAVDAHATVDAAAGADVPDVRALIGSL
jgi:hypothetical protein